jgi:YVTN family beta-propeller protein
LGAALFLLLLLDLPSHTMAQSYARPTYSSPIAISRNDKLIWSVNPGANTVSVIRPDSNAVITNLTVGAEPQSVALTPDGKYAFVANAAAGTVSAINISDPAWGTFSAGVVTNFTTGAEPWNIVTSPDGYRVFVANSAQDTITVLDATNLSIIGHVDLRNSIANDPDRSRVFQPRGLAITEDNTKLYVTRFLSYTKAGGRQGDDFGKEGVVAVLDIDTTSSSISSYHVARVVRLAPQITGFKFPGLTNDTGAFPNQLQSIVIRGERAYLPNIAASPTGPLRFNVDTHAFVNQIGGAATVTPSDLGAINLHLGADPPEAGKTKLFFPNLWGIAFTTQSGTGTCYAVSAGSDLLVKLNVAADGTLSFTAGSNTTRYIDLNDPTNAATSGANAGKNPQGIAINSTGTVAYVMNFVSRNVSVVDLTNDAVIATVQTASLPAPGSQGETNLVGAEMFFSSRGNFDTIPGTNSLHNRLSQVGWQSCASCHFKGLTDGVIWQFNAGPRKSVPLNASFSQHNLNQQRLLNYSAIFDEVEDFELNIRNVSGPGNLATPINGNPFNPNQGLMIGDNGDLNVAPTNIVAFAQANATRQQLTVTLPGSTNKVPALTALREWVRNAVRTPNAPFAGLPNGPSPSDIATGRAFFVQSCSRCHGGANWTISLKDFTSPTTEFSTETSPAPLFGSPVGLQYLNRFLRDIGSFNLGVPGKTNDLGNNIGAPEKAAPVGAAAAQDALGIDYNGDGKGVGFNVPSLLGIQLLPPYMHNGAAESLAAVLSDPKHRTDNGRIPDVLSYPPDQAKVVAFLQSVDAATAPVFEVANRSTYSSPIAISANDHLIWSVNPADDSVSVIRPDNNTRIAKIKVGREPQSIALTPDNNCAFVANTAGNSITIIDVHDPAWGTFSASVDTSVGLNGQLLTGAEPWNIVCSPDGKRVFVANSGQDTITVISTAYRSIIGHVDLRHSVANDPNRNRHFQPRGLAVTADNSKLYVTRFLSFTKAGGRQGDDFGKEGLVTVLDINTSSVNINDYKVARTIPLSSQITGFKFDTQTNPPPGDTAAFPNQLQSIVIRGESAYLPNIAASPTGPLRFNLDTHAFVSVIDGANTTSPQDGSSNKFLNLHVGARTPEAGKRKLFFANPWAIAFTTQLGDGFGYAVSAASDLLVKVNIDAAGKLSFTGGSATTRFIDLNEPTNAATSGANAGKNPQGIAINSTGTRAYVANFVSRNVSVVDLTTDSVIATVPGSDLPASGSQAETNLVGAEMFFSSRGNFDTIPGTNSLVNRLSNLGWQSCSSCHFKGLSDGVIWQFNAGPRKSVPLNASFGLHDLNRQRVLNYSAIFDEIEDFELNIRNVSGPGNLATPINGNSFNPNQGLMIGDNGDLNVAPTNIVAFAQASATRQQLTVTLPGSTNKVPALTALREWVRNAVRTPNAPLPLPWVAGSPSIGDINDGRRLFTKAGCATCHGGVNWTVSVKDFTSPTTEFSTETSPAPLFGTPVAVQYLNRYLRDVGSFNLGVPGKTNDLGNNIGADEKAAAAVNAAGVLQNAQDALGIDYNGDGKGIGFNVPSLLGLQALQPYLHNGAAETLADVVSNLKHRTDNGRLADALSNPADQARVVTFLESIDEQTVPFVTLAVSQMGNYAVLSFDSLAGVNYAIEARDAIDGPATLLGTVTGTGQRVNAAVPIDRAARFYRLVEEP